MKKIICMTLALVLCIGLLVGCGGKTETEQKENIVDEAAKIAEVTTSAGSDATPPPADAQYADMITTLLDDKVPLINPFNPGGSCPQQGHVYHMMYETLIDWTLEGDYVPALATEWTASEDGLTWNFKLREGVKFHNGETFTADDVLYTYEAALAASGAAIYNTAIKFESLTVINDYEIEIVLKEPNYDFEYNMSQPTNFVICNRKACEADPDNGPMIATGPYRCAEFIANESILYERFDDYWGELPPTKTVFFRYIAEETARYIMLENGETDYCVVSGVYVPQYANNPAYELTSYCVNNCGYIAMNCSREPMNDINFRWACAYAINRDEIVDVGFSGFSQKHLNGGIWGWATAYANPDIPDIEQDVEKAKEYLAKSSYSGQKLQIYAAMAHTKKIAAVIMSELTAIGINCEVCECDGPTLTIRSKYDNNDMDMIVNSAMFGPIAQNIEFEVKEIDHNKAVWNNAEARELCAKAAVTPNGEERQEMYYRIQQIMFDEMPYIPTTHNALYTAGQAGTGGAKFFPTGMNDFSYAYKIVG